jgi:signal transduction histidine kinase
MRVRVLAFRYVGALLMVAGLLVAGQTVIHQLLARQDGDARVINMAGRQRMLGQRLCTLLLTLDADPATALDSRGELMRTADAWETNQAALRAGRPELGLRISTSEIVRSQFARIDADHRIMLAAAHAALAQRAGDVDPQLARTACAHQDSFLVGMDSIVGEYEHEARQRIAGLRRLELALLGLALLVLALEGVFVLWPLLRELRLHLTERVLIQGALDASEIDRARLERELLEVSDREQLRLAQDLHDGLGQQLIGAALLLRTQRRLPGGGDPAQLDEIERLLREAIGQTRDLVRSLHSPTLETAGLAAALGELAERTQRLFGVPCRVCDRADVEPPVDDRVHLHRIACEAVVNAAKHASATVIEIHLARDGGELVLAVRDDGIGIAAPVPGAGLHLMACRAKLVGASLRIAAGAERGTVVTCRLPLRALPPGAAS